MSPPMFDRWLARPLLLHAAGVWDGQQAWPGFDAWCEQHAGRRCTLWLSTSMLLELVCPGELPLADDRAVIEWARPLLQHYHGPAAAGWPLAAWQQGRRRGVSVLHGTALAALQASAQRARVRLAGVRPWWSLVLRRALRRHAELRATQARLLVIEVDRLAVLSLEQGRLAGLEVRRLDGPAPAALQAWCDDGVPTLAVGYGLHGKPPAPINAADTLHGAHPAARWLA